MKRWFYAILMIGIVAFTAPAYAQISLISCVGQTPDGTPTKVILNFKDKEIIFESKPWPIAQMEYRIDGVLLVTSLEPANQPDTYLMIAIQNSSGLFLLYSNGDIKYTMKMTCQNM